MINPFKRKKEFFCKNCNKIVNITKTKESFTFKKHTYENIEVLKCNECNRIISIPKESFKYFHKFLFVLNLYKISSEEFVLREMYLVNLENEKIKKIKIPKKIRKTVLEKKHIQPMLNYIISNKKKILKNENSIINFLQETKEKFEKKHNCVIENILMSNF